MKHYCPLIILGAPRSGTNMLREVLASLPGFTTWPCDEINLIWRYGNAAWPTDALPPDQARPEVVSYIRKRFDAAARPETAVVVEKTCANCLRVPFVDRVLPQALYVEIVRDGSDAIASAMNRWTSPTDIAYTLRKARFVPASDIAHYCLRFLGNRVAQLRDTERRLATWGPLCEELAAMTARRAPLAVICAYQWRTCVEQAAEGLAGLPPERVFRVRYETFVRDPLGSLESLLGHFGMECPAEQLDAAVRLVSAAMVGKGRSRLDASAVEQINAVAGDTLGRLGYDIVRS